MIRYPFNFAIVYLSIAGLLVSCESEQIQYEINNNSLTISSYLHGKTIQKKDIVIESMKVVDLSGSFNMQARLWGIGQPKLEYGDFKLESYSEGWFLLNNGEISLSYIGDDDTQAVYFKTRLKPPKKALIVANLTDYSFDEETEFSVLLGSSEALGLKQKINRTFR